MDFNDYRNSEVKTRIDYIKIKMDYCSNLFGVLNCSATGEPCYNTFPSCKDLAGYNKIAKEYTFISDNLSAATAASYFPARPYIKSVSDLPTEIKAKDTIISRLKITLLDEPDDDIHTDPYYRERTNITGTYWKKWLARNKNYKGRIVELYEGYAGLDIDNFQMKFSGRLQSIKLNGDSVTIEVTDQLSELSKKSYPLKSSYSIQADMPNVFIVGSQAEMENLKANLGDYAERTDFKEISIETSRTEAGEMEVTGSYIWTVVAYDAQDRPIAKTDIDNQYDYFTTAYTILAGKSRYIAWYSVDHASYYKVFYKLQDAAIYEVSDKLFTRGYSINSMYGYAQSQPPIFAELIYKYLYNTTNRAFEWTEDHSRQDIEITLGSDLNNSGFIKIEDEIIYYSNKNTGIISDTLQGIRRHKLNTEPAGHDKYTVVYEMFLEDFANPFYLLTKILSAAGIEAEYLDDNFTTYKNTWTGINFSTNLIAKDTKFNIIYFDLVNALDCISFQGEDGKIKIIKHSERSGNYATITDAANIIEGSGKVDLNEESRFTRWFLYWNRYDIEQDIEDAAAYNRTTLTVDADAESANEYNDVIDNITYSTWINTGDATETQLAAYINNLLEARRIRQRNAKIIYECSLTNKDNSIKTGDLVLLSTNDIQDKTGAPISGKLFRVIKKTPKGHKFNLKLLQIEEF